MGHGDTKSSCGRSAKTVSRLLVRTGVRPFQTAVLGNFASETAPPRAGGMSRGANEEHLAQSGNESPSEGSPARRCRSVIVAGCQQPAITGRSRSAALR
jgi:hypothetical protein